MEVEVSCTKSVVAFYMHMLLQLGTSLLWCSISLLNIIYCLFLSAEAKPSGAIVCVEAFDRPTKTSPPLILLTKICLFLRVVYLKKSLPPSATPLPEKPVNESLGTNPLTLELEVTKVVKIGGCC